MLGVGDIVIGRYEVTGLIGRGGSSRVYMVHDLHVGRALAMKVMDRNSVCAHRFARSEIEALRSVRYPLFPAIIDAFRDEKKIYIVSEYVRGTNLKELTEGVGMPKDRALVMTGHICEALIYLHTMKKPMLYLDLKPENIIVDEKQLPHLIDFGISGALMRGVGTIGYSPPEQYDPFAVLDKRSDIFALGMTYYSIRHGRSPDKDPQKTLYIIRHSKILSSKEKAFLKGCCAPKAQERFRSAEEVLKQIRHIRTIPDRHKKRIVTAATLAATGLLATFAARASVNVIRQNKAANELATSAAQHMKDGQYTPEGIGIIKTCINSGNLSEDVEQRFIFEVAQNAMLISQDYKTAQVYFARLDRNSYPEADEYVRLCRLESGFDVDGSDACVIIGKLFSDIVKRSPSPVKYENLIFIANCFENYDPDRDEGPKKALSVLTIADEELKEVLSRDETKDRQELKTLHDRIESLTEVKRLRQKRRKQEIKTSGGIK